MTDLLLKRPATPPTDLYFALGGGGQSYSVSLGDSVTGVDTLSRVYGALRTPVDDAPAADTLEVQKLLTRYFGEAAALYDVVSRATWVQREIKNETSVADALDRLSRARVVLGEGTSVTDVASRGLASIRTPQEDAPADDTLERVVDLLRSVQGLAQAIDALTTSTVRPVAVVIRLSAGKTINLTL